MNSDERPVERRGDSRIGFAAYYALAAVFIVQIFSLVDRNILAILLVDIQRELDVSDAAMGVLTGSAFAVTNAIAGIPLARLADRRPRRIIIAVGLAAWSALTALQGLARSFAMLAVTRVGVGIGEASAGPAAQSMISDYFRPEHRATALAIYTIGGHCGVWIGLVMGGWLNEIAGWRAALVMIGLPGLLVAPLIAFTVREPARGQSENLASNEKQAPLTDVIRYLWAKPTYRHLCFAAPLLVSSFYCINIWGPAFLIRIHDLTSGEVGMRLGPIMGGGGALGTLFGGFVCDRLSDRYPRIYLWLPGVASLGMIPFLVGFLTASDPDTAFYFLAPTVFLAGIFIAPIFSLALGLARVRMRATSTAAIALLVSVVAAGLMPQMIGIANDVLAVRFGEEAVRYSLFLLVFTNAWGATHAFVAARSFQADIASAQAELELDSDGSQ